MKKFILLVLFVMSFAAIDATANLVTNGGFETGDFTGWTMHPCG